jgi:hypothetical protein
MLVIVYNGQVTTQTDLLLYVRHKNPGGSGCRGERIQFAVECKIIGRNLLFSLINSNNDIFFAVK